MTQTVLLVDSQEAYRNSVAEHLSTKGMQVVEAESGKRAVALLKENPCDILIIDNTLSDQSGVELLPLVKEIDERVPIILIVEPNMKVSSTEEFTTQNGITKLVRGPVHARVLAGHVEALLSDEQSGDEKEQISSESEGRPSLDGVVESNLMAVRQSYQEKLPSELSRLQESLKQVQKKPSDKLILREAHQIAHTLHGTAGTLGFAEVSLAAGEIEEGLKRLLSGRLTFEEAWDSMSMALELAMTAPERPSLVATMETKVMGIARVLLVDDDQDMMASVSALARNNLISIVPASSGVEAVSAIEKKKMDGVIIDVTADTQDKLFELAGLLRSVPGQQDLPIAVMSSDNTILNRVAATHAGASKFLQKPLNIDELMDAVREFSSIRSEESSKILIVDDDEHFGDHIAEILKSEGMETSTLREPEHILETMDFVKPDILLLDVNMPKISGFDVCRLLRSSTLWKNLPILFLTAESDANSRLECFRAGGDDYIEKPVIREELLARIGVRQERIRLFRERADIDSLTGLPNRRAFLDLFKLRVAEARRYGRPLALCLIDLDKFKSINDTYGHLAGDQVLMGLGRLLSSRFRSVDIRGRWGGEEFALVFYGEDAKTVKLILSRVLDEFNDISFQGDQGQEFNVTFSCGIATFPMDGETFDELFRVADSKLYIAKEKGRSRIEI